MSRLLLLIVLVMWLSVFVENFLWVLRMMSVWVVLRSDEVCFGLMWWK